MPNHNHKTALGFSLHLGDTLLELVHYNRNFVTEKLIIFLHATAAPNAA